ncbi:MAG: ATPase P [Desulfobacteraceae bacterium]|jgi:soluble P-type ATPase|nr:ATPase P [Desulfobacteraceae bacterium]
MIEIDIPGYRSLRLEHLVCDFNGTLALDGKPVPGVRSLLQKLSDRISVHVVTADTFGAVREELADAPCRISVLPPGKEDWGKLELVRRLGAERTVCIGNGRNDRRMIEEAALGIVVVLAEGAAVKTLMSADVVAPDVVSALELLAYPLRLVATLRC